MFDRAAVQFVVTLPPRGPSAIRSANFAKPFDALMAMHCSKLNKKFKMPEQDKSNQLTASSFSVKENKASLEDSRS
jgi:hypothetical protein